MLATLDLSQVLGLAISFAAGSLCFVLGYRSGRRDGYERAEQDVRNRLLHYGHPLPARPKMLDLD